MTRQISSTLYRTAKTPVFTVCNDPLQRRIGEVPIDSHQENVILGKLVVLSHSAYWLPTPKNTLHGGQSLLVVCKLLLSMTMGLLPILYYLFD